MTIESFINQKPGVERDAFGFPITNTEWTATKTLTVAKHPSKRKRARKVLFPVGPPAIETNTPEFAWKQFTFVAGSIPQEGRTAKAFLRDNQCNLRALARDACKKWDVDFSEFVMFVRSCEQLKNVHSIFDPIDLAAEEVEETPEELAQAAEEEQIRKLEEEEERELERTRERSLARQLEEAHSEALAEDARRTEFVKAARAMAKKVAQGEARKSAGGRRIAARASRMAPEPQPEPEIVPESEEVKQEGQRREFARMVAMPSRRRRAEQFLSELRSK